MAYINFFFLLLIKYKFHLGILLFLLICILILFLMLKIKIKPTVKIENFFLTYFLVGIYILFYILLFVFIRIYQLGKELDLKIVWEKYLSLLSRLGESSLFMQIVFSLIFFIIVLLWIIIFFHIRKILEYKLWQVFFYYKNIWKLNPDRDYMREWSPYLMWRYYKYLSFKNLSLKIYFFMLNRTKNFYKFIPSRELFLKVQKVIPWTFFLLLLLFIFTECIMNNFVLFYTFYYLMIYMLIIIWIRIGLAIDIKSGFLEEILIERAYGEPNILYVNLTKEEEILLELYITDIQEAIDIDLEKDLIPWGIVEIHPIMFRCRFEKIDAEKLDYSKEEIIYYNKYRELYFFEKDIEKRNGKNFVSEEIQN